MVTLNRAILVLQYPDPFQNRTVAIASTRNSAALVAFKAAALEDARLAAMDWEMDEVLSLYRNLELERLVLLFESLIPDSDEATV